MTMTLEDAKILQLIDMSGQRAANGPHERPTYYRLLDGGYIRRVPFERERGDVNDPLVCELTQLGKEYLASN